MKTDSDVASWLQPAPRPCSKEWNSRKAKKNSEEDKIPVVEDVVAAREEILVISPTQEVQDVSSKSQSPTSTSASQKQARQLPLALRRLNAHNEAVLR